MLLCLENVVDADRLVALAEVFDNAELFADGAVTAGQQARAAKQNLQAKNSSMEVQRATQKLRAALLEHPVFVSATVPAEMGRMLISRYEPGMHYGLHFDEAYIDKVRTDLSFTLFLSEPDSYSGGELELHSASGTQQIKLPAGCVVVYPGDQLHQVMPVTHGVRLAAVGWLRSRVRSAAQRQLLFDLAEATAQLDSASRESGGESPEQAMLMLKQVRNNLLRMWGDH